MKTSGVNYNYTMDQIHDEIDHYVGMYDDDTVDSIRAYVTTTLKEVDKIDGHQKYLKNLISEENKLQKAAKKFIDDIEPISNGNLDANLLKKLKETYSKNNFDIIMEYETLSRFDIMKNILIDNVDTIFVNASALTNENKDDFYNTLSQTLFASYEILDSVSNSKAIVSFQPEDDGDHYYRESRKIAKDIWDKTGITKKDYYSKPPKEYPHEHIPKEYHYDPALTY